MKKIEVLKENKDEFILLGVYVYVIGYQPARNGASALLLSSCTVVPSITSICLLSGYSMINLRRLYLRYEISGDNFFIWSVTELNPVTYDLSVSCCCFELDEHSNAKFNTYLNNVFASGCVVYDTMFIIL